MFWLIAQVPEKHNHNRRLEKDQYGRTDWVAETHIRLSHNPKKGIGYILWIEADSAQQAWQYCRRVLNLKPQRWRQPRNPRLVPSVAIEGRARYHSSPILVYGPIYLHFTDGSFIRIDHLRHELINDITALGEENDW